MAETTMVTRLGAVELRRGQTPLTTPLRAWSAADVLVVDEIASLGQVGRLLVVNDAWGALSVAFAEFDPTVWTDSAVARASIDENLARNARPTLGERAVNGDQAPMGPFDTVVFLVPKHASLLRYQAERLVGRLAVGARVLVAGMSRHLAPALLDALTPLGEVTPRRAVGKARLVDVVADLSVDASTPTGWSDDGIGTAVAFRTDDGVVAHRTPGVFSGGHVDIGTALLLDELAGVDLAALCGTSEPTCLDLGCGNGIIGATLARRWPATTWHLSDVSDLAVAAARATWQASGLAADRAHFAVGDGAAHLDDESIDLVVTNPPFHHDHALDRDLTDRLLRDVARVVRTTGAAVVVAQRHLKTHVMLRRHFDDVSTVSGHPSHVVMVARSPRRTSHTRPVTTP